MLAGCRRFRDGEWLLPLLGPCPSGCVPLSAAISEPAVRASNPLRWPRNQLNAPTVTSDREASSHLLNFVGGFGGHRAFS